MSLIIEAWLCCFFCSLGGIRIPAQTTARFPEAFLGEEDGFQTAIFYSGDVQGNFLPCG